MRFKIKKTVNGETVWEPIKAKKYTASKTIEYTGTLPITINSNGKPLIDYRIYGNTEQTGTPTPENPIMPIGCGERTENLFDANSDKVAGYIDDCGVIVQAEYGIWTYDYIDIYGGIDYTYLGYKVTAANFNTIRVAWFDANKSFISRTYVLKNGSKPRTVASPSDARYARLSIDYGIEDIVFTEGSTAPTFYIHYGYKLPILSNSTVTNIYLGEAQTTRRIKKLVLTGTEDWTTITRPTYTYGTSITPYANVNSSAISSHFIQRDFIILANKTFTLFGKNTIYIKYNDTTSVDDFKQFLAAQYAAGTPVTIWYVLEEPETAVVNEPLMKIGDYADTVDSTQANVQIPTVVGTTTIDYDGTTKPSGMYIKYNSWSGWSDIDNYKMVNGDWTQEMT